MVGWSELKKILDQKLVQLIAQEQEYVERNGPRSPVIEEIWSKEDLPHYLREIEALSNSPDDVNIPLIVSGAKAKKILEEHDIDLSGSHDLFVKFCVSVLQMYIEFKNRRVDINKTARTYKPKSSHPQSGFKAQLYITT